MHLNLLTLTITRAQGPDYGAKMLSFENSFKNFFGNFFKNFFKNCFGILWKGDLCSAKIPFLIMKEQKRTLKNFFKNSFGQRSF